MKIEFLADNPHAIPILATWYFNEWAYEVPGMTIEKVEEKVGRAAQRSGFPLSLVAKEGDKILGAAELKIQEMDIYPPDTYWLGSVYVSTSHRGKGIAAALVDAIKKKAHEVGIEELYLQTEALDGGLYKRHGFVPMKRVNYKGVEVLVMVGSIDC